MTQRARLIVLLVLPVLVYANTLWNGFAFDDEVYILSNSQVTHPTFQSIFSAAINNVFRPIMFAGFALEWKVGHGGPLIFHALSVLLHAAVTLLLFLVLQRLLEHMPGSTTIAFVAALLFAVHPIHAEAVDWASAQSELLAAGFLLAAWLLHLHSYPIPATLSLILALLAKESAVVFLPLLLVADYARGKLKPALHYLGFLIATVAYLPLLWLCQGHRFGPVAVNFSDNPLRYLPPQWRILNSLRIAWKYVGLHFYPATLSCDYSYNSILLYTKSGPLLPWAIAAAVVIGAWIWALRARKTEWTLAGTLYFAGFAVTANLFLPTGTIMGERLAYLPSAGFCLLIAVLWARLNRHRRELAWALLVIVVATLAGRSVVRNWDWRTNYSLYSAGIRAVPGSCKMHANLGITYFHLNRLAPARQELETALHIYPDLPQAVAYLGLVQASQGQDEQARTTLEKAVSMTYKSDFYYRMFSIFLAVHLEKMNKDEEALNVVNRLISQWPDYSRAWYSRAAIEYRQGNVAAARADTETALRLEPTFAQAQNLLSTLNSRSDGIPQK